MIGTSDHRVIGASRHLNGVSLCLKAALNCAARPSDDPIIR